MSTLERYAEHLDVEQGRAAPPQGPFARLAFHDLEEHLKADAPLKSIVAEYRERLGHVDPDDGWP